MMKRLFTLIIGLAFIANAFMVRADEGMWLPVLVNKLNIGHMTEKGFKLSAEDVYSINQACLKDAIIALDYGSCTGEIISDQGLVLTNHHCGYSEIQYHSTVEHDYLTDGFWAKTLTDELPNEGKTASFLIRAQEVTDRIVAELNDEMKESERWEIIDSLRKVIIAEVKAETPDYRASVTPLLHGNQFMLFVYEDFKDIRLVGAPPESIGKYGADTDNWMWPRHTGDFAMFRIYADKDNKPAEYSKDNVPYTPKKHLTISLKGVEQDDYAMIMGYPGRTNRYLTSWGVKDLMENSNALRAHIRGIKQDIWMEAMDADDATRIQYASKYAGSSNYWKYSIGQNQGLKNLDVIGKKEAIEAQFTTWAENNPKYADALGMIKTSVEENMPYTKAATILTETMLSGAEIFLVAYRISGLQKTLEKTPDSTETIASLRARITKMIEEFYKDYQPALDQKVTKAMIEICKNDLAPEYHPAFFNTIDKKFKGDVQKYIDKVLSKSVFYNKEALLEFIHTAKVKDFDKEPVFTAANEIFSIYRMLYGQLEKNKEQSSRGYRLFVDGLTKSMTDKTFYPDANSSMRVTYGSIGGYEARDAVTYCYYTTMEGVMEKENPNEREFNVKAKLKELYEAKDYGRYADKNGKMVVGFLSNNDITGGNSGSPVMNGNGELIGIAFDGNWEAMSGDIAFEPKLQRTISVDIRFVLFIIDKFAGATHLIDEMTIVE
ncbi:MAG: S46 family peptidase [Salinivirgaceae bacterium]|nr:S46 family peptidase [Salinivirgaceae bacterium]MDY0279560.1 S46 family peptidase [Salinivirgaceae bacterium]